MPCVLNVRALPGFRERKPIIPPGAVYIGHAMRWYRLPASKWRNPFVEQLKDGIPREGVIDAYAEWFMHQPDLLAAMPELRGHDLVCWRAPEACHGEVLLRLANAARSAACLPLPERP
jgi:hypothetical protein